jgi:glycosyltransferase involved in cell wall biosynthesis
MKYAGNKCGPLISHYRLLEPDTKAPSPPTDPRVRNLSATLWLTGSSIYLQKLEHICRGAESAEAKCYAARELSKWYLDQPDTDSWLSAWNYSLIASQSARTRSDIVKSALLRIVCSQRVKRFESSKLVISELGKHKIFSPDIILSLASPRSSGPSKVRLINQVLSYYSATPVTLLDNSKHDLLDSISGVDAGCAHCAGPKVSVLIATYSSSGRLETALRSLQEQTWRNCEFIIVDDASPDSQDKEIAESFASRDNRFKYIRMPVNSGAYAARNTGLQYASGEFVTLHDSDDWSHPQKIETQVKFLLANSSAIGCTSQQARCTNSLSFDDIRSNDLLIFFNTSSFLWRKQPVVNAIGSWDTVRFGADSEFIRRIKHHFGELSVVNLKTGPLSFQRKHESNVTSNRLTGLRTLYCGARKEYAETSQYFLANCDSLLYSHDASDIRPFPVPKLMLKSKSTSPTRNKYDYALFADVYKDSPDMSATLEHVNRLCSYKARVALIPVVSDCRVLSTLVIDGSIRKLCHEQKLYIAVYGETIYTKEIVKLSFVPSDYPHKASVVQVD